MNAVQDNLNILNDGINNGKINSNNILLNDDISDSISSGSESGIY
jgi:hypothetical protein